MDRKKGVFLSHHTDTCGKLVTIIDEYLSAVDIPCWYAERDVEGSHNYTEDILSAIHGCNLFVLLLNQHANTSRHVLREVNLAMREGRPIMIIRLDDCEPNDSLVYVSSILQMITIKEDNLEKCAQRVTEEIVKWHNENKDGKDYRVSYDGYKTHWEGNDLAFFEDEKERGRISTQNRFVYRFAHDIYDRILSPSEPKSFLDVGCNTGVQARMFLSDKPLIRYVGIDREEAALEYGRELYPDARFYQMDCEAKDFDEQLSRIEEELGIEGFDYINVSMLLLHLHHPGEVLDVLSDHLAEDGQIIVLDIDDGFNIAYPDPKGYFKKAVDICFQLEYSGYRHCGRTVYKLFSDVDLREVCLHRIGLSTVDMSRREKDEFYEIYFSFILDDLQKMHAEFPDNKFVETDLKWLEENYKEMKLEFKKKDFFFTLGFVLFTAKP